MSDSDLEDLLRSADELIEQKEFRDVLRSADDLLCKLQKVEAAAAAATAATAAAAAAAAVPAVSMVCWKKRDSEGNLIFARPRSTRNDSNQAGCSRNTNPPVDAPDPDCDLVFAPAIAPETVELRSKNVLDTMLRVRRLRKTRVRDTRKRREERGVLSGKDWKDTWEPAQH